MLSRLPESVKRVRFGLVGHARPPVLAKGGILIDTSRPDERHPGIGFARPHPANPVDNRHADPGGS
jgi:hypothetical protein